LFALKNHADKRIVPKGKVMILDHQSQSSPQFQEALSGDNQWYVLIGEQEYGPLCFGDLAQLAKERRLLENDWVWKPGLESWIAAEKISGLFTASVQFRRKPTQLNRSAGVENETRQAKYNFKERAKDQIRNFALMFLYLWVVFGLLAIHESIILSQHQISYQSHGFAVVNALVFAKVMLVAEDLHLGHRLNDKPLIYSIAVKSLLFGVALICFHIVEHVVIGMWDGKTIAESVSEIGADRLGGMVSVGVVSTVALVPFFILREIGRVIGEDNLWALFVRRRTS